jgi:hypothetical protein
MSPALRLMLILGCLMLAALEAPRSSALVAQDLGGPYRAPLALRNAPDVHVLVVAAAVPGTPRR